MYKDKLFEEDLERAKREYESYSNFEYEFYQWEESEWIKQERNCKIDYLLSFRDVSSD